MIDGSKKNYFIDTNLTVRFITGYPEKQAAKTALFLKNSDLGQIIVHVTPIVVAEVVFVLTGKVYSFDRKKVVAVLKEFLFNPSFVVEELESLELALDLFANCKIDFADAYLGAKAKTHNASVATFDQDFKKLEDVECLYLKR